MLDGIYRSYGILKYARKVSLKDGLVLLHKVTARSGGGACKNADERDYAIYQLMIGIQPGNLEMLASQELYRGRKLMDKSAVYQENLP